MTFSRVRSRVWFCSFLFHLASLIHIIYLSSLYYFIWTRPLACAYNGVRKQLSPYPTRPARPRVFTRNASDVRILCCDGCVYLRKYNKYVFYKSTFFLWCPHCRGRYSVTIGDCETPGMELAPGFWVKNDDDNNYYDTTYYIGNHNILIRERYIIIIYNICSCIRFWLYRYDRRCRRSLVWVTHAMSRRRIRWRSQPVLAV